jgi:chromosome segregation ATPase
MVMCRALSAEAKYASGSHQEKVDALLMRIEKVQAELEGEKRGAGQRCGELEGQICQLIERNAVLEAARERSMELEGRLAEADTGVLKLTESCEMLKAQLGESTASLLRAGEEKSALEDRLKAAEESLSAAQRELDMSVEAIRELQQERKRLGEERDATR